VKIDDRMVILSISGDRGFLFSGAYPDISARSLEDFRTLQGARAWLARVVN
jgi:hypothetical protein